MIAFATADWMWLGLGVWLGVLLMFAVIVFLNWPEPDPRDEVEVTAEEFINGLRKESDGSDRPDV